jgi:ABC-type Na+ efflux pump permease subunit
LSIGKATLLVTLAELRGSFRDKQTLLYAVVLPICLYPALFWILLQGALVLQARQQRTDVRVVVASDQPDRIPAELPAALAQSSEPAPEGEDPIEVVEVETLQSPLEQDEARAWLGAEHGQAPDAVLWIPQPAGTSAEARAQLFFDSSRSRSKLARARVEQRLDEFVALERAEAAVQAGGRAMDLVPFEVSDVNVAQRRDMVAYVLSYLLPLLLVVMCVMGAFFPAVDVTAGEEERSTVETTLLLPIPRKAVHQGKILAVCAASVLATVLNLGALGLSAQHLLSMLTSELGLGTTGIPVLALLAALPLALLFAFFVSAILVGVASLAANFREGQALLGPVQMLFLLPATAAMLPGLTLDLRWALVPVVNVVLAYRSMIQGDVLPAEYTVTALALTLYSAVAIRIAVRVLSRKSQAGPRRTGQTRRLSSILRRAPHVT